MKEKEVTPGSFIGRMADHAADLLEENQRMKEQEKRLVRFTIKDVMDQLESAGAINEKEEWLAWLGYGDGEYEDSILRRFRKSEAK